MKLPQSLAEIKKQHVAGKHFRYVFFWGHRPKTSSTIDKSCLSQWFSAPFEVDNVRYATAEHFMMAEKARLFGDAESLAAIVAAPNPGAAKKLGRGVRGFDQARWVEARMEIVTRANVAKFGQNAELRDYLLGTRKRVLVEASPVDKIWGIGLAVDDPAAENPSKWRGLNLLGFALMAARTELDL